ncbi:S1C family serine protease [Paenibacillus chartarius]|uniref:S1C family serine protease n=1 Tax=Paenibacillus chartarius TaxID=747481 RepID=A0ABV6DL60_9BACL
MQKTPFKHMFAAFMAGSVVVGSLMFASDQLNVFSGGIAAATPAATPATTAAAVQTASATASSQASASLAAVKAGNASVSDIAKAASPAVVKIETVVQSAGSRSFTGSQEGSGIGSGFIFDASGYILTNEHVVDGASQIQVYVQGYDKPFTATLLGSSYDLDLAVLKIEGGQAFPTLALGSSENAQAGDWVVAIGNPYDFDYTVTAGVLSAKEREISIDDSQGTRNYKHLIQTDTSINPGNSGGPLLNMNGEVIGINTAVSSEAQGIGFAIPAETVSSVIDKLKNNESIPKQASPYIGVSVQDVTEDMQADLQLNEAAGVVVMSVQRQSPAFQAGVRQYDVITAVNGSKISNTEALTKQIQAAQVGDTLSLTINRAGKTQNISVKVNDKNAAN